MSLRNGNIRGFLPESLQDCTWLEERLCARYLASAYIVRLYDFTAPGAPEERPRVMKGHTCAFPLNTVSTAAKLPWAFNDGGPLLSCIVIGPRKPRLTDLKGVFKVRRQKVLDLLKFLQENFRGYPQFKIDLAAVNALPADDVPELLMRHVVHQESGIVPSLFDGETAGLESHPGLSEDDDVGAENGRTFLEHHGMLDVNGAGIPSHMRSASALSNATGTERPDLIIKHGSMMVADYNNPALFPGMFPLLFPWGIGGFESERTVPFAFDTHASYLLDIADPAFRTHWSFIFVVANIKQRRAIHNGSRLVCKSREFAHVSRTLAKLDTRTVKRVADHVAAGGSFDTLVGDERKIFNLMNKCQVVSRHVPGSKAAMDLARADIRAYVGEHGIFHLFLTLNPRPEYAPTFQIFFGNTSVNIDLQAPTMPSRAAGAVNVADDPVAAADYFHFHVSAVFQYLFGWDVRGKKSSTEGGILGPLAAFFLVKEHTMRGQLHGHALLWLKDGLNPRELRQRLQVDAEFQTRYLSFMDDIIQHHLPGEPAAESVAAKASKPGDHRDETVRQPRSEMPPSPLDSDYGERFEEDHRILGDLLQRHSCRATCFKGGRNTCRFFYPHTTNELSTFDAEDNSINLRIKDPTVVWHNPQILVATRHNHDLKSVQSGKSSAAAAAYITNYATKSDETPVNQIAMINTVYQRLEENNEILAETKTLLSKCVMQFGRERQLHAQQVATYVRDLSDTFKSHTTIPMLSGSLLARAYALYGPPRGNGAVGAHSGIDSDEKAQEDGAMEDKDHSGADAEELLSLSPSGMAHQVTDYLHRGESLMTVTFYDFVRHGKLVPLPKKPYKVHHRLGDGHPNKKTHCHRYCVERSYGIPRAIFRSIPRPDGSGTHGDAYCASMLIHFRPFSIDVPLKPSGSTYEDVFADTVFSPSASQVMRNWTALSECDDARDQEQLLRRKREANHGAQEDNAMKLGMEGGVDDQNADINTQALLANAEHRSKETNNFVGALSDSGWFEASGAQQERAPLPTTHLCPPFTTSRQRQWKTEQAHVEASAKAERDVAKARTGVLAQDLGFEEHFHGGTLIDNGVLDFEDVKKELPPSTLDTSFASSMVSPLWSLPITSMADGVITAFEQEPLRMLMHGEAGTGKTVVVRLLRELLDRFGKGKEIMFLAPTGKAASAIGGVTQHSAFRLEFQTRGRANEEVTQRGGDISARKMQHLQGSFQHVRWLFFDEVSMTSSEVMADIDQGLRIGTQRLDEPFGGVNVIFAGDLCQLPPVGACPLYLQQSPVALAADIRTKIELGRAAWMRLNTVVDFRQQMRMRDERMAATLSRLRLRSCTDEDATFLNGNVLRSRDNPTGTTLRNHPGAVALARTNETVRILNLRKAAVQAQSTSTGLVISHANDSSTAIISEHERKLLLSYNGSTKSKAALGRVPLFVGMPVVYRGANLSVPLGVTNGAFARVVGWDLSVDRWGLTVPRGVILKFSDNDQWALSGLESGCLPIAPAKISFKWNSVDAAEETAQVTRSQLPLQAGFAMTIHSAQGVTATGGIIVDLRSGGFETYVAASRATRREDVFLVARTSKAELNRPKLPSTLVQELERLRLIADATTLQHDNVQWRLGSATKRPHSQPDSDPLFTKRQKVDNT
ncbi:hypothetical protein CF319_g882 [Tilletia indica]|nr:hypothetical protein CF319_g882 [Tilletia indica]